MIGSLQTLILSLGILLFIISCKPAPGNGRIIEAKRDLRTLANKNSTNLIDLMIAHRKRLSPVTQRLPLNLKQISENSLNPNYPTDIKGKLGEMHIRDTSLGDKKKKEKLLFRIGLIVPKTAFSSQYKTYTQRIKDHLLQLSRQQAHHDRLGTLDGSSANTSNKGVKSTLSLLTQHSYGRGSEASCHTNNDLPARLRLPWPNLTFNQHFDIRVVDLVNFGPRSSAHDIIESMCQKLIEQNVSVIVYLENNQDQTVTSSLDSQNFIVQSTVSIQEFQNQNSVSKNNTDQNLINHEDKFHATNNILDQKQAPGSQYINHMSEKRVTNGLLKTGSQAHYIMHLAHSAGIPMIAWSVTATQANKPKKQKILHLAPTVAHEVEAMLAIMRRYSWYTFSVVSSGLAGHKDFILALRHFMNANGGSSSASVNKSNDSGYDPNMRSSSSSKFQPKLSAESNNFNNISIDGNHYSTRSFSLDSDVLPRPSKT